MASTTHDSLDTIEEENQYRKKQRKQVIQEAATDPLLSLIPNDVQETILFPPNGPPITLPSKLAYPFWYEPHPIAKWAADQLKAELPPYTTNGDGQKDSTSISLGKMYGVLVVQIETGNDDASLCQSRLGYLKAYSGTMPRAQYGGNVSSEPSKIDFCPLVYDRFQKNRVEDSFCYEQEEEILNGLTREIEQLESCPDRETKIKKLKKEKEELEEALKAAKKTSKSNKRMRKDRRTELRTQLIEQMGRAVQQLDGEHVNIQTMSEKDSHKYFLETNDEYRHLEEELIQESALDQREFRKMKNTIEEKIECVNIFLEKDISQIQTLKDRRKQGSIDLQNELFHRYQLRNAKGDTLTPLEIFRETPLKVPPSGAGDCAAIKLFQHAFTNGYRPVALAEFWWGPSPHTGDHNSDVARTHGNYYPCCRGKCEPILTKHMLLGTDVESDPLMEGIFPQDLKVKEVEMELPIVYEDEWLVVVNKPHDVLSVPGRKVSCSVRTELQKRYPNATGPLLVHRLDYSTSGLLVAGKDIETYKRLQSQFIERKVKKRYTALLEGDLSENGRKNENNRRGTIDLPLAGDYMNRPMQKVEYGPEGKPAVTHYEIVESFMDEATKRRRTRVHLYPVTGRTHQLRVHAFHPEGLGIAMVGDDIYGQRDKRLCLHAGFLQFLHPHSGKIMTFEAEVPF